MGFAPESGPLLGINNALTDADGHYEITDLRAYNWAAENQKFRQTNPNGGIGQLSVFVYHPDYAHQIAGHSDVPETVDIALHKPMVLEGQVLWDNDGKPAAGIELELVDEKDFFNQLTAKVHTDANGHYHLAVLPPGEYVLRPHLPPGEGGPDADRFAVKLQDGKQSLNLRIDRNGIVRGHESRTAPEVAPKSPKPESPESANSSSNSYRGVDIVVQCGGAKNISNGLPEELGPQIAKLPGVDRVISGLLDMVSFHDEAIPGTLLNGWPPESPLFDRLKLQTGRQLTADDQGKIVLGYELARRLNKKIGDKIELYGSKSFGVIGIFESPISFENNGAVVPLEELQLMMNKPGVVTGFTVVAKRPIDEDGLKDLAKRIELFVDSLHHGDNPSLQVKAMPAVQFVQTP